MIECNSSAITLLNLMLHFFFINIISLTILLRNQLIWLIRTKKIYENKYKYLILITETHAITMIESESQVLSLYSNIYFLVQLRLFFPKKFKRKKKKIWESASIIQNRYLYVSRYIEKLKKWNRAQGFKCILNLLINAWINSCNFIMLKLSSNKNIFFSFMIFLIIYDHKHAFEISTSALFIQK